MISSLVCLASVLGVSCAFEVYWNIPSFMCRRYGLEARNLTELYGIKFNENDNFRGEEIAILYDPGNFPAILQNTSSKEYVYRNFGVPQEGNIQNHLNVLEKHIDELIPDANFAGLAIIDFESWRPTYRQNFGSLLPYKTLSVDIEKKRHRGWSEKALQREAKERFEVGAKDFMLASIWLGQKLRPQAKWGYYAFPYCFNGRGNNAPDKCAAGVDKENNAISWLFKSSNAIFPSIYLHESIPPANRVPMARGRVKEGLRVARLAGKRPTVMVYYRYVYADTSRYINEIETYNVLKEVKQLGADGVVLWGSSDDLNSKKKCEEFSNYMHSTLGPVVSSLQQVYSIKTAADESS